jgi:hypothetical protein
VLISGALAERTTRPLTCIGRHTLRDVAETVEVFAL